MSLARSIALNILNEIETDSDLINVKQGDLIFLLTVFRDESYNRDIQKLLDITIKKILKGFD